LEHAMIGAARDCASSHDLQVDYDRDSTTAPTRMSTALPDAIETAAQKLGLSTRRMPSGAGHDAQVMAALAPTGMIFVPSHNGRSHSPLESTSWEDVARGANVLLNALLDIATARS